MAEFSGCTTSEGNPGEIKTEVDIPAVELVSAEKGILTSSLTMPGELISFQQVDLYARETSFVENVFVDVGSQVKKGEILATLEAPEIASRLAGAESRRKSSEAIYIASKAGYERLKETSKTPGTISSNDLDQALSKMNSDSSQLEAAKSSYREVQNTLDYLTIRAPFSGVISARNISPGAYVGPSGRGSEQPLLTLQEQKHLRLVVSVPEAYTPYIKKDDEVNFNIQAMRNKLFPAKVVRMAGALDVKLRSQRVEMDVINEDGKLLPGMVAGVIIPLVSGDSTFVIPNTSIVNSQERVFVIKVEHGKAKWVDVQAGRSIDGKTEVYGTLQSGDRLVKKATEEIRDGALLKI